MLAGQPSFDRQFQIFSGKFRRYHGESWLRRLLDVRTNLQNLRDAAYVLLGTVQSWFLLRRLKPNVILLKGGFVGVPVGIASRRKYPMITHDSDVVPGLANRLVGKWAVRHATGQPVSHYRYPKQSSVYTGVLVGEQYRKVTPHLQALYKEQLHLPANHQLLFVTGGSLGASAINQAMVQLVPNLLQKFPKLHIIHQVGKHNLACYGAYRNSRLQVFDLVRDMYVYSGAADVVITRAGANTLAELGVQAKACIVVPNPQLTGGHQTKNSQILAAERAIVMVEQQAINNNPRLLQEEIIDLLAHSAKRQHLGKKLNEITVPDATDRLARLILEVGQ